MFQKRFNREIVRMHKKTNGLPFLGYQIKYYPRENHH